MDRWEKKDFATKQRLWSEREEKLTDALVAVTRSLIAAISVIEHTPESKKAFASDKMFNQAMRDYKKAADASRAVLS